MKERRGSIISGNNAKDEDLLARISSKPASDHSFHYASVTPIEELEDQIRTFGRDGSLKDKLQDQQKVKNLEDETAVK